jgi:transcriptional regulator with XRE-family HTH domain
MRPPKHARRLLQRLGAEIRHRREKRGDSQVQLAQKARVHLNVIGRTERGIYNSTVLTLKAIAAALGLSVATLMRAAAKR